MTPLTADAYAVALAALVAILLSHTTLKLAMQVSATRTRTRAQSGVRTLLLGAVALGFGLWTTTFVRILAFSNGQPPPLGTSWLLLSLAVAVSSQACALYFVACREPDASNIAGAAFALAVGVGATRYAALDQMSAEGVMHDDLVWCCIWFPLTFLTFLGALRIWFDHADRSWRAIGMRCAGTLAGALCILGNDAPALAGSRWVFDSRSGLRAPGSLLALTSAALGCVALATLPAMIERGTDP